MEAPAYFDEPKLELPQMTGMTAVDGQDRTHLHFEVTDSSRMVQIYRAAFTADVIDQHIPADLRSLPAIQRLM